MAKLPKIEHEDLLEKAKAEVAKKYYLESWEYMDKGAALVAEDLAKIYASYFQEKLMGKGLLNIKFFKGENDLWYWSAKHPNGNKVATQGEGLVNRRDSMKAFRNFVNKLQQGLWKIS